MCIWLNLLKMLGVIMSHRGIKIDPENIKAITEMPAPRFEIGVRDFLDESITLAVSLPN